MKIILINPPFLFPVKEEMVLSQCLGLRYISSYLKANGSHKIEFIDALNLGFSNIHKYANGFIVGLNIPDIIKLIPRDTDLIGISVPFSQLAPIAHDIIDNIKSFLPAIPIVMGGVYPSTQPGLALSSKADMIVVGEGERAVFQIAEGADPESIKGVYTRKDSGNAAFPATEAIRNLDAIPFPDDSLRGVENYFSISPRNERIYRTASLITSRGCPFSCEFCSVHPVYGHTWRGRSPENVLAEIEYLHNKHGINSLEIEDDNFTLRKQRSVEILEGIVRFNEKGWNLNWRTPNGVRIDTIDEDVARLIKKSNCREIVVALEHGDPEILQIMNKQMDLQKAYNVLKILVDNDIPRITVFVMTGYPGETKKRFQNGLEFLKKVKKLGGPLSVWTNITQPYPGTPLLKRCKEEGYLSDSAIDNFLIKRNLMSTGYSTPITTDDFDSQEVLCRKQAINDVFNNSQRGGQVKILLCGWYFQGNTGDELSIEPIADTLKMHGEVRVTTTETFDQSLIDWCDILVIGSGSHITPRGISCYQHVKYAKDNGKKIVYYSQTIEEGHPLFLEHLSRADLITVRDSKSKEVVEENGFRAVIAADPIFIKKRRTIGLSLRSWVNEPADIIEKLAATLDNLATDYDLIFMPFTEAKTDTESDASFHERIIRSMKNQTRKGSYTDNIEKVDLLIGMRLHALITAVNMGKQVLAIEYDAKIGRIFSDLALQNRVVSYNEVDRIPQIVREKIFSSDRLARREKINEALIAVMCADVRGEKKPAISVVMPTYNRSVLLKEAIDSIVRQSFTDWELILIDDGSTDDTEALVRSYGDARIRYYNFGHNGISYSRNIGNLLSRGDIIAVADSDDINLPNRLEVSYKRITEGKADIVYSSMFHFTPGGHQELIPSQPFSLERLHKSNMIYHPTVAYRREVALQCPYSEDLEMVEDYHMYLRAADRGYVFYEEEEPLVMHRIHEGQISAERSEEMSQIHAGLVHSKGTFSKDKKEEYLPLVSVIMPTFNRPEMLKEAIGSVLAQSYQNLEIIVVNDAGIDVADVVKTFNDDRIVYISHKENKGLPAARNTGLKAAKGEYIAYLDDDDVYYPNHLETLVGYLIKGPCKVAYTDSCQVYQSWITDRYVTLKKEVLYSRDFDRNSLFVTNYIPVLNLIHRRDLLEESGYFDEALDAHEDWDLWIRFAQHSDFYHIKEVTAEVSMRVDGTTMTSHNREPFLRTMKLIHARYAKLISDENILEAQKVFEEYLIVEVAINQIPSKELSIKVEEFIKKKDRQINGIDAALRDTHVHNANLEASIRDKDVHIGNLEAAMSERDKHIENIAAATREKDIRLSNLETALREKDISVSNLEAALREKNTHIGKIEVMLRERDTRIDHLGATLNSIYYSHGWRFLRAYYRMIDAILPRGTKRRRICELTLKGSKTLVKEGPRSFLTKLRLYDRLPKLYSTAHRVRCAARRWKEYRMVRRNRHETESIVQTRQAVSALSVSIKNLPSADGSWEWRDYIHIKSKINEIKAHRHSQILSRSFDMIDIGNEPLELVATRIKLPPSDAVPDVSIIIPAFNHIKVTLECLLSIAAHSDSDVSYEIIVADDASTDETAKIIASIPNVRLIRNETNLGFLRNCNHALEHIRGKYVLYLNNDVQVTAGWLKALVDTFDSHPDAGAVGPRFVYPDGRLQEAGAAFRPDGAIDMVGSNENPAQASFSYIRRVDYVSGACLMLPAALAKKLGGFSEDYLPCYCEDCDLCLRIQDAGYFVYYNPASTIVHHLSKTTGLADITFKLRCVSKNFVTLQNKWQHRIDHSIVPKVIAFYLPQYYPFPENDQWWGAGFTEWVSVTKAQPNFVGHYQPRLPADLGFYDLRLSEIMVQQAELASRYGIHGFCFHYYWFGGKRLLDLPIEQMLSSGKPDFPFCLCWANENWTRKWDGEDSDVLMAQAHSADDDKAVILDMIRFFRDKRYIRIDGRPLILIYRVTLFPDFAETAARWRSICREQGIGEIYIALVESFDLVHANKHPKEFGCDAAVEFPPHWLAVPKPPSGEVINPDFEGVVADYRELAVCCATRGAPAYTRFRGVIPGWDNTARRQNNSFCCEHATPGAFQAWLEETMEQTRLQHYGDERLIFVNAWNEWAEAAYLEPDRRFGHSYLEAVKNALEAARLLHKDGFVPGGSA